MIAGPDVDRRFFFEQIGTARGDVVRYFGGASEAAHRIGARHCDVYMLWGEPLAAIRDRIAEVRAARREQRLERGPQARAGEE